jgi:hypothetical protein
VRAQDDGAPSLSSLCRPAKLRREARGPRPRERRRAGDLGLRAPRGVLERALHHGQRHRALRGEPVRRDAELVQALRGLDRPVPGREQRRSRRLAGGEGALRYEGQDEHGAHSARRAQVRAGVEGSMAVVPAPAGSRTAVIGLILLA